MGSAAGREEEGRQNLSLCLCVYLPKIPTEGRAPVRLDAAERRRERVGLVEEDPSFPRLFFGYAPPEAHSKSPLGRVKIRE